jgi:hypothetical protein
MLGELESVTLMGTWNKLGRNLAGERKLLKRSQKICTVCVQL